MKLSELFKIFYGQHELNNKENLDQGSGLLISSQAGDNGCYGFFDVKPKFVPPFITVPRTGSIGFACVQLRECSVDDNVLVLEPLNSYATEYLFYIVSAIRSTRWRYSYGRVITPERLGKLPVVAPEEFKAYIKYEDLFLALYPKRNKSQISDIKNTNFKETNVTELFELERGQFHALDRLSEGNCPTISRVSTDNGLVGFYKKPREAIFYKDYFITISTVTGDAFLQFTPFIATDNVLICKPKMPLKITSLMYIQTLINKVKWRYSYGRQCYRRVFQKTIIYLPTTLEGKPDEDYMEAVVTMQPYWKYFRQKYLGA